MIAGGCGTLSFDYMKMYTSTVQLDVVVNGTVRHTIVGTTSQSVVAATGPLDINVGGNFTLKFVQHNSNAGQVAIDNVSWTSYGGADPEPPEIIFTPDTNSALTAYSNTVNLTVTATEPNEDAVALWATGLPAGAAFAATNGPSPLMAAFSWKPTSAQTGLHSVVFYAGDKDGTNSRAFSIEVTPIYPYYHYAEGLTGAVLRAKLHDIISTGAVQLNDTQENDAMKVLHTDSNNVDNVYYLYNVTSSVPKTLYNENNGWNKEHCWPASRGLGSTGPDQVDVHNLFAEDIAVNALRGNLYFDESDPADLDYLSPATSAAPETSMDSNSFEPPPKSKGNVARGVFYMATRYDGGEPDTSALWFSDNPTHTNSMGILTNLLLWHAMDPPDAAESNKNELIYANYQHNRNPFVDRPEWVEKIWGVDPDGDGVTTTHEILAGTNPNNSNSVFTVAAVSNQISCGLLSTGSTWYLYEGAFQSNDIVWRQIAKTNTLQSGTVRFPVAPTGTAAFYHLRATRP
ncbi:MAG: endonuclease I family protein [Kiritimatiellia bacterium]